MRSIFEFTVYEYKKIFMRKITIAALLVGVFITVLSVVSLVIPAFYPSTGESRWEFFTRDREYTRALAGQKLDAAFLVRASEAVVEGNPQYATAFIHNLLHSVIAPNARNMSEAMEYLPLSYEEAEKFFAMRHELVVQDINRLAETGHISGNAAQSLIELDGQIETPFVIDHVFGFDVFLVDIQTVTLMLFFIIVICIAPIFAYEHSTGVSQLILTSKHGKRKLIAAKILAASSFCLLVSSAILLIRFFVSMAVFGADGWSSAFQLTFHLSPYPITLGQASIIAGLNTLARSLMFGAVLLFLSAKLKSSFGVMIGGSAWIILAILLYIPLPIVWLQNIGRLFINVVPTIEFWTMRTTTRFMFSVIPYEFLGLVVPPFVFEPVFSLVVGIVVFVMAGQVFKRYQVG